MFNKKVELYLNQTTILIIIVFNTFYCVKSNHKKIPGLIYILPWTDLQSEPFRLWSTDQESLIMNNCSFQNCYIVKDRDYFQDMTKYDAILFTPIGLADDDLPIVRSVNQIYVFTCVEPATNLELDKKWNWFFNYTWTYRLDSDIIYPFFFITNNNGERVGPKINSYFRNIRQMEPTPLYIINRLIDKSAAAAWFVSRCVTLNDRSSYAQGLNEALQEYNLSVDFYGPCPPGNLKCPKEDAKRCLKLVEKHYYFYLAFENSNCEDYISEKLMIPLGNYAVPVVLGGANYSYFMPKGIYLDANILSTEKVAEAMHEAIKYKQKYYDYFRWHQYYTYRLAGGGDTDPLCEFCAFLNNESTWNTQRAYAHVDKWWNQYRTRRFQEGLVLSPKENPHIPYIQSFVTNRVDTTPSSLEMAHTPPALNNIYNSFTDMFEGLF